MRPLAWSALRPDRTAFRYGDLTLPCQDPPSSPGASGRAVKAPPGSHFHILRFFCPVCAWLYACLATFGDLTLIARQHKLTRMIRYSRARPVRPHWHLILLLILLVLPGCVRHDGRNSDCQWPRTPEPNAPSVNQRDLRADLEFAEELAIRYMDAHYGPSNPEAAAQAKNRCMGILLREIGKEHGITAQEAV
jgi:hypothetical protein